MLSAVAVSSEKRRSAMMACSCCFASAALFFPFPGGVGAVVATPRRRPAPPSL
ncbi:unnamed protein product [Ectocarpus sp. CCAP 1310/34]|nr:unnamed protein product [Ectocarpus sp. CCAP 1310/34]